MENDAVVKRKTNLIFEKIQVLSVSPVICATHVRSVFDILIQIRGIVAVSRTLASCFQNNVEPPLILSDY